MKLGKDLQKSTSMPLGDGTKPVGTDGLPSPRGIAFSYLAIFLTCAQSAQPAENG